MWTVSEFFCVVVLYRQSCDMNRFPDKLDIQLEMDVFLQN